MSLYVFLVFCILGVDFMIYAFFQWTYGDKRSALARKLATHENAFEEQLHRPFLVHTQKVPLEPPALRRLVIGSVPKSKPRDARPVGADNELLAGHHLRRFSDYGE